MNNPKTSLTAFATAIAVALAHFGFHVAPDTVMVILTVGVTLIGHFAHDGKAQPTETQPTEAQSTETGDQPQ